jgi:hypothetical protein
MDERRTRLRFEEFLLERFPDGRCRAEVRMSWTGQRRFIGEATGTQTMEGEIRASAEAALAAIAESTEGRLDLRLRGAKAFRAFDAWMVVVSVNATTTEESRRLWGAFPCTDEDTGRAAVLAVLDSTNRILERYLVPQGHS